MENDQKEKGGGVEDRTQMTLRPRPSRVDISFRALTYSVRASDEDISALFESLDSDGNGKIDAHELQDGLRHLGLPAGMSTVQGLMQRIHGTDKTGITMQEFATFVHHRRADIMRAFHSLRDDQRHRPLTSNDFRIAVERAGLKISDDQLRVLMRTLDKDGDGRVCLEEFCHALMLLPDVNPSAVLDYFLDDVPVDGGGACDLVADGRRGLDSDTTTKVGIKLGAGAVAGAASRTCTAPLDRIRAVMQAAAPGAGSRDIFSVVRAISRGGFCAFFKGNGVNCVKIAPETAVKFAAFDAMKHVVATDPANITVTERLVSGGFAGMVAQALIFPLEVVKTRLAVGDGSLRTVLRSVLEERAFFRGLGPSLLGVMPYAGLDLATMSFLKDHVASAYQATGQEPGVGTLLICGMVRRRASLRTTILRPTHSMVC